MTYVHKIIETFGGVRPLARQLARPPSTVKSWRDRGSIPDANKSEVLMAAHALGLPLTPADFFPLAHGIKEMAIERETAGVVTASSWIPEVAASCDGNTPSEPIPEKDAAA